MIEAIVLSIYVMIIIFTICVLYTLWHNGEDITIHHWLISLLIIALSPTSFVVLLVTGFVMSVLYTVKKLKKKVLIKGRKQNVKYIK